MWDATKEANCFIPIARINIFLNQSVGERATEAERREGISPETLTHKVQVALHSREEIYPGHQGREFCCSAAWEGESAGPGTEELVGSSSDFYFTYLTNLGKVMLGFFLFIHLVKIMTSYRAALRKKGSWKVLC